MQVAEIKFSIGPYLTDGLTITLNESEPEGTKCCSFHGHD